MATLYFISFSFWGLATFYAENVHRLSKKLQHAASLNSENQNYMWDAHHENVRMISQCFVYCGWRIRSVLQVMDMGSPSLACMLATSMVILSCCHVRAMVQTLLFTWRWAAITWVHFISLFLGKASLNLFHIILP